MVLNDLDLDSDRLKLVEQIIDEQDFHNFQLEYSAGSAKGENFLSSIVILDLKEETKKKSLSLVLKLASKDEQLRERVKIIRDAFLREAYLYESIHPAFLEFETQYKIDNPFSSVPTEYGSILTPPYEMVILENMKLKGFELCDKKYTMNSDHIFLVLNEYAKFHAISLAMRELQPKKFEELSENMNSLWIPPDWAENKELNPFTKFAFNAAFEALKGYEKELTALKKFSEDLVDIFPEMMLSDDGIVITHGDCWCNNMMFRYEDSENPSKPTSLCLLDWQLSRKGSPAEDLAYFLCCSAPGKELSNIDRLLKIYHNALAERLKLFGCDIQNIFPFSKLEEHWKVYCKFGLCMAISLMRIFVSDSSEALDIGDITEENNDLNETIGSLKKNNELYNQRIQDIVCFMVDKKYI